jgi:hypothetical protein
MYVFSWCLVGNVCAVCLIVCVCAVFNRVSECDAPLVTGQGCGEACVPTYQPPQS